MDRTTVTIVATLCLAFVALIGVLVIADNVNDRTKADFLIACTQNQAPLECAAAWRSR